MIFPLRSSPGSFDLSSLFSAVPPGIGKEDLALLLNFKKAQIEADAEVKKADAEVKKAEAEVKKAAAEVKKAEAEAMKDKHDSLRAVAEKEKIEIQLRFSHGTSSRLTVRAVIKYDGLGLKTKLSEKMREFGLLGCVARVPREDGSGEYDTDFTFEGSKSSIDKMKNFLKEKGFEASFPEAVDLDFRSITILRTELNHRKGSSGSEAEVIYKVTSTQDSSLDSKQQVETENSGQRYYCEMAIAAFSVEGLPTSRPPTYFL
ncbi:hypothetical protein TL16_g10003 [Triparma laevis f. inornata]|uniref:Uncharacterized protein n=1 Tax=Triparma laevis f. inornata TaxID=1714386 RepID=A0A9W7EKZ9_9STRA|nr:hypothetical protein TL16_g10003 [Triparma laevis f. inornata]